MRVGIGIGIGRRPIATRKAFTFDPDALAYIEAVETADGEALEVAVRKAINALVVGCKADESPNQDVSNWAACKSILLLGVARTLAGALVPLKGAAPVNQNFTQSDLVRGKGLQGDGASKRLVMPRNIDADPQNNKHLATFSTSADPATGVLKCTMGGDGNTQLLLSTGKRLYPRIHAATGTIVGPEFSVGFLGASRASASLVSWAIGSESGSEEIASSAPSAVPNYLFSRHNAYYSGAIAFASDGEAIDLIAARNRVVTFQSTLDAIFS